MVEVGFDTSNLAILTKKDSEGSIICESCCGWSPHPYCPCDGCEPINGGPGIQPKLVKVTFSGIEDRTTCVNGCSWIAGMESAQFFGTMNSVFNTSWILEPDLGIVCSYYLKKSVGTDIVRGYGDLDCEGRDDGGRYLIEASVILTLYPNISRIKIRAQYHWKVIGGVNTYWGDAFYHVSNYELLGNYCIPTGIYLSNTDAGAQNLFVCGQNEPLLKTGQVVVMIPTIGEGNENLCTE